MTVTAAAANLPYFGQSAAPLPVSLQRAIQAAALPRHGPSDSQLEDVVRETGNALKTATSANEAKGIVARVLTALSGVEGTETLPSKLASCVQARVLGLEDQRRVEDIFGHSEVAPWANALKVALKNALALHSLSTNNDKHQIDDAVTEILNGFHRPARVQQLLGAVKESLEGIPGAQTVLQSVEIQSRGRICQIGEAERALNQYERVRQAMDPKGFAGSVDFTQAWVSILAMDRQDGQVMAWLGKNHAGETVLEIDPRGVSRTGAIRDAVSRRLLARFSNDQLWSGLEDLYRQSKNKIGSWLSPASQKFYWHLHFASDPATALALRKQVTEGIPYRPRS